MRVYLYSTKTVQRQLQLRPPEYAEQLRQATVRVASEGWYIDVDHPAFQALQRQYQHQPPNPNEPAVPVDVVIPLSRGSQHNDLELRYALRSIRRYLRGVQQIWLVGHKPDWVEGVQHLPAEDDTPSSDRNIMRKLLLACQQEEVAEQIIFWSDDQVVLVPIAVQQMGPWAWGEITPDWQPQTHWHRRLKRTADLLRQKGLPAYHYDTHIPVPYRKAELRWVLEETRQEWDQGDGVCVNTWVCNHLYKPPVETVDGRKATIEEPLSYQEIQEQLQGRWFLGYNDAGLGEELQKLLEELFPAVRVWASPRSPSVLTSFTKAPVGLLTYALHMGGAERWMLDIVKFWDDRKIQYLGMGISTGEGHPLLLRDAKLFGPVVAHYDQFLWQDVPDRIVLLWGHAPPLSHGKQIFVAHGSSQWTRSVAERVQNKVTYYAAVSPATAAVCPNPAAVSVIPNGVDLDRCRPIAGRDATRRKWGIREGQIAIGYLGRIGTDPCKNLVLVAQAAAEYGEHWVPVFIGAVLAEQTKQQILSICPRAIFVGGRPHVGDALAALDCLVLASKSEGCSLALLEAWAAGTPTVATPVGAVPYFHETYDSLTVLVPVECSTEDLIRAILYAIAPANQHRVQRAQEVVRGLYNSHEFGRRWTEYLCAIHAGDILPDSAFVPSEEMVSIVTPVYNTSPEYLQECWQSLQQQTWKHWEWVVVDDGSTQSATVEQLQQIAGDPRVRYIRLPEHRGVAAAANIGLLEARYELIARLDSDDIAKPTWLARMVAFMKAHPEIDICGCQIEAFDDVTKAVLGRSHHPQRITHDFIMQQVAARHVWFLNHPGVFYRRQKIREIGWYDESLPAHVDQDLWLRAHAAGLQMANVADMLMRHRRHANQLTGGQIRREITNHIQQAFLTAIQ